MSIRYHYTILSIAAVVFCISLGLRISNKNKSNKLDEVDFSLTDILIVERHIDLGKIKRQETTAASGKYYVVNVGKNDLEIADIEVSCQCTALETFQDLIRPGDTAEIHVEYSKNKLGYFYSDVLIHGNFNKSPEILSFEGFLISE
jgi:hypothetical protein